MHRFADEDLALLSKECEDEAGALRHWAPTVTGVTAGEPPRLRKA